MFIFYQPGIDQEEHYLDKEESRHCIKVLRKQEGDSIQIADGKGHFYQAVISQANDKKCTFSITKTSIIPKDNFSIHIALSPTKNIDRTEWFVEKAVEIGVHHISFILCENSERKVLKLDRLERKAISAMKQSQHAYLPEIHPLISLQSFLKQQATEAEKYIAYLGDEPSPQLINATQARQNYVVLIGPEGDFSSKEVKMAVENGFKAVSLGNSRLRTETAGIVACHSLQLLQQLAASPFAESRNT
ncbi:16S rRNA (uracil(1498)-N(3))-methyltransferase [Catalinimonas niigatensis]|uniref:16S rRNA (uracil(1498)-N(3))-methyltransferase n=1 Tax=Catalinimonas niigatensis TaxID=1397264 RepID=UPI002666A541|nr:16S rRNA (uracil(1498)-N(3))-methyltransferase [Catalinimonas niigatensis]WPP49676.1 16S rRNA (uracil(1498)-N(3))-methyltransferase [Catalinimonas niigatensis]